MRTIKFRGKRTYTDMWIVGSLIPNGKKRAFIAPFKEKFYLDEVRTDTVGQFTGLTDKNGKEIYEGDVIQGDSKDRVIRHFVKYDEDRARFAAVWINKYMNTYCETSCEIDWRWIDEFGKTVIGNIHDNPELLKGGEA